VGFIIAREDDAAVDGETTDMKPEEFNSFILLSVIFVLICVRSSYVFTIL
jgi:hypothetical protein